MAIFSPLRMRRKADLSHSENQRFIAFQIGKQQCALPIDRVVKAAMVESIYTEPQHPQLFMTRYKGKELLLIDLGREIFNESSLARPVVDRHILIVRTAEDQVAGLAIDSAPRTFNIPTDTIQEAPAKMPPIITGFFTVAEDISRYFVLNLASL
jgi:chemotaxis signal transduction protein